MKNIYIYSRIITIMMKEVLENVYMEYRKRIIIIVIYSNILLMKNELSFFGDENKGG